MNRKPHATTGHTAEFTAAGFARLLEIIRQIRAGQSLFYVLQDETVAYGISESLPPSPEHFAEGRAFGESCELRWRLSRIYKEQRLFDALLLTESAGLAQRFEPDGATPRKTWDVAIFSPDAANEGTSPAKLWAPTETRLPVQPQYPDQLLVGYAVYEDQTTHAARLTRLIGRLSGSKSNGGRTNDELE